MSAGPDPSSIPLHLSKGCLAAADVPGCSDLTTGTTWTPGHTEMSKALEDIFLPYLQSPLLSGPDLLRDVFTLEEESTSMCWGSPILSAPAPVVPPLLMGQFLTEVSQRR